MTTRPKANNRYRLEPDELKLFRDCLNEMELTIKDLAKSSGVSYATARRALEGRWINRDIWSKLRTGAINRRRWVTPIRLRIYGPGDLERFEWHT